MLLREFNLTQSLITFRQLNDNFIHPSPASKLNSKNGKRDSVIFLSLPLQHLSEAKLMIKDTFPLAND